MRGVFRQLRSFGAFSTLAVAGLTFAGCGSSAQGGRASDAGSGDGSVHEGGGLGDASDSGAADTSTDQGGIQDAGGSDGGLSKYYSWNPAVSCTPIRTTVEHVLGTLLYGTPTEASPTFSSSPYFTGIKNKNAVNPPCSVAGVPVFVELHNLTIISPGFANPSGDGDTTATVEDQTSSTSNKYLRRIHIEIPLSWKNAKIAPATNWKIGDTIDIQGFIFWDPAHLTDSFHSYDGWEVHPISAWKKHGAAQPARGTNAGKNSAAGAWLTKNCVAEVHCCDSLHFPASQQRNCEKSARSSSDATCKSQLASNKAAGNCS